MAYESISAIDSRAKVADYLAAKHGYTWRPGANTNVKLAVLLGHSQCVGSATVSEIDDADEYQRGASIREHLECSYIDPVERLNWLDLRIMADGHTFAFRPTWAIANGVVASELRPE